MNNRFTIDYSVKLSFYTDSEDVLVQITPAGYQVGDGYDTTYSSLEFALPNLADDLQYYIKNTYRLAIDMEGADLFSYEKLQARPTITEDELTTLLGVDRKHIHPYDSNKTLEEIMDYLVHIKNNK